VPMVHCGTGAENASGRAPMCNISASVIIIIIYTVVIFDVYNVMTLY